jgi:Flp pilus assembly protein TadD
MARAPLLCLGVLALLAACTTAPGPRPPALSDAELLSGDALAVSVISPVPIVPDEISALDDVMREFVAASVGGATDPRAKLQRLLDGMRNDGLFEIDYAEAITRTARTTFHERRGNCLSFTILFVALARAAGLDVRYQVVDVPPTWSGNTDLVVVRHHINTLVRSAFRDDYVIDFNLVDVKADYESQVVDDGYVLALFYNNLGAEAMLRKEYETSFRYVREAVRVHPAMPGPWVNLGALYSRNGLTGHAEAAYLHALALDPRERSALSNLANVYAATGQRELAEIYRQRIHRYQERNPYYHYSVAETAYDAGRFADALAALRIALRLKRDEPEFYVLQGRAYLELGHADSAAASVARGRIYAAPGPGLAEYDARVEAVLRDVAAAL